MFCGTIHFFWNNWKLFIGISNKSQSSVHFSQFVKYRIECSANEIVCKFSSKIKNLKFWPFCGSYKQNQFIIYNFIWVPRFQCRQRSMHSKLKFRRNKKKRTFFSFRMNRSFVASNIPVVYLNIWVNGWLNFQNKTFSFSFLFITDNQQCAPCTYCQYQNSPKTWICVFQNEKKKKKTKIEILCNE